MGESRPGLFWTDGPYLSDRALARFDDEVLAVLDDDVVLVRATPTMRTVTSTLAFRGASGVEAQQVAFDGMLRALSVVRAFHENLTHARGTLVEVRGCLEVANAAALQGGYGGGSEDQADRRRVRRALRGPC